ncbi:hypothetical protein Anapl_14770 [Anas platyrhynchos]|uniref:Uncharacterized protein n=1 Tax=Anas platyrhynchos TaxID=8839 RepID=R0LC25_ANAPL|nr:hypothetical protein Anapl_14770 [Anas platyrhynchos]
MPVLFSRLPHHKRKRRPYCHHRNRASGANLADAATCRQEQSLWEASPLRQHTQQVFQLKGCGNAPPSRNPKDLNMYRAMYFANRT